MNDACEHCGALLGPRPAEPKIMRPAKPGDRMTFPIITTIPAYRLDETIPEPPKHRHEYVYDMYAREWIS